MSQLSDYIPDFQVKNHLQSFTEEILDLPQFDKLFNNSEKVYLVRKITFSHFAL